ncbi:MAG TPA: acyl-CoA dehydratase activase [Candidatus Methylomirabilis sp.]|nr:acyl-CoA dehydratase activase [Candidatus Methylomirabilis sp.]HSD51718.1 acyl-CoA dehydratase activase [Candidatus Methylomirabilis sp.]
MSLVAGIDLGSGRTKVVLVDETGGLGGRGVARTKGDFEAVANEALESALAEAGVTRGELRYVATTGLGRYSVSFRDIQITDITCGAKGAAFLFPSTEYVLDMGAQSTRAVRLRENGKVKEFHMNEKCAAGSGGFLERAAKYLEVAVEEIGQRSLDSQTPQPISSICAVLAESEIINHVSEGRSVEDILAGIHVSLAERSLMQLKRVGMKGGEVTFIGGVALQAGMVKACQAKWGFTIHLPAEPQYTTALGAALLGWQRVKKLHPASSAAQTVRAA